MSAGAAAGSAHPSSAGIETLFAQERKGNGTGDGVPLVLLHGFGGDHTGWLSIVSRLSKDVATLAYDLPGHGRSLNVPGAGRAGAMSKGVLADLDARGVTRFHLCGHSMGGAVATLMAMRAPDRVASLTLLGPGGFGPEIAIDVLRDWGRATSTTALSRALRRMTAPGHVFGAFEIGRLEAMRRRPGQREKLVEITTLLADEDGRQGAIDREAIRSLSVPTTLVWGDRDPVLPASQADGLDDVYHVLRLQGAGHMLMEERPAAVARALRERIAAEL